MVFGKDPPRAPQRIFMAPQSNEDSISFKSHVWLLFTRAREVKESGGQCAAAVWKAERRWPCSGFVASYPGSRLLHLPPGQKLIKSSCDISKSLVACFHSRVFSKSSTSVTFFFSPLSLPMFWVMCGSGGCWRIPEWSPHREREHTLTSSPCSP